MDINREFTKLTTKFLFLNCTDADNRNSQIELNTLLNELNSLEYQNQKLMDPNAAVNLLESFTKISSNEQTLVVKSCVLIVTLVNKQKVQIPRSTFQKLVEWLIKCLNFSLYEIACEILSALQALFKNHPDLCEKFCEELLQVDGLIFRLMMMNKAANLIPTNPERYDSNSAGEVALSAVLCIESMVATLKESSSLMDSEEFLPRIGSKVIEILYSCKTHNWKNPIQQIVFTTSAINVIYKIGTYDKDWLESKLGEVLGISKAYMHYGLLGYVYVAQNPQKIVVSQQSVYELNTVPAQTNKGGKMAKTRKLRSVSKNKRNERRMNKNSVGSDDRNKTFVLLNPLEIDLESSTLSPFSRTSESDFSESEFGRSQNERHKTAKLRLSALSLIIVCAKFVEKRILYGYWHALFPTEPVTQQNLQGVLATALKDPNPRCRITALQATSLLLYESKGFLIQAESSDKAPSTFMPFSVSLGLTIVSMYENLTQALSAESSLPVLTQLLKCLSVLIQATPFHRLKSGLVENFVQYIRRLVYHKDPTIQVAALMVMEFLVSVPEITEEISDCVGVEKIKLAATRNLNQNKLSDIGNEEIIVNEHEEAVDSDTDELVLQATTSCNTFNTAKISWLLQKVLEYLGVVVVKVDHNQPPLLATTPLRIESLQVISAMAQHFFFIKDHLELIASTLEKSLNDSLPEIRLYSGKCLDTLGNSINTFLLQKSSTGNCTADILQCQKFWNILLASVVAKIQDDCQNQILKSTLCDVLSNIGIYVYETLPRSYQIQLISLLSGVSCNNEENTVRAAAVRALAVYVMFPSLREDLCFIENTAESIIQLLKDQNLYCRIKASWSLGNISDALLANITDSQSDKISDDLLQRLCESAIIASGDNDKIRSNGVRSLGNLLRLFTAEHLAKDFWRALGMRSIEKLVFNITAGGNAKVKWNSCYAVGNFFKNSALFATNSDFDWQSLVFAALCTSVINCTNFKVRINAASALTSIKNHSEYGQHLIDIWSALLAALEQSDNLVDFNEYKHRDNLQEQLCIALCHIIQLARNDDFIKMKNSLVEKLETTKQNWVRVTNRVLPENSKSLIDASGRLKALIDGAKADEKNAIKFLASCFIAPGDCL